MVPAAPPIEQLSESARRLLRRGLEISACELFFILRNVDYGIGRPVAVRLPCIASVSRPSRSAMDALGASAMAALADDTRSTGLPGESLYFECSV